MERKRGLSTVNDKHECATHVSAPSWKWILAAVMPSANSQQPGYSFMRNPEPESPS